MKRLALALLFVSSLAYAGQGMTDNLTGVDPITNLPTYAIIGLKQLAVGTDAPDVNVASEVLVDQATATVHFITNKSAGVNATAADVVQASSSDVYGTAPYAYLGVFGTGYVGLGTGTTPFFIPGNAVVQYSGAGALVFDTASVAGEFVWSKRSAGVQVEIMDLAPAGLRVDPLGGSGTRCLQTDNAGNVRIAAGACGTGTGTVTSVTGTAGRIVVAPSSPNPVVDLATFGTASTCAWANVVVDAWGRTTCTANTAPQPAGSYITALNHDVTASGPGAVAAEVTGITDSGSTDWQVTGTFANGKALGFVGGGLQAVSFQAPLTACTDYVSLSCVTGATDLGGTNATPTVIGIENDAAMRGDLLATEVATPSSPAAGKVRVFASTSGNVAAVDPSGTVNHGAQTHTAASGKAFTALADTGAWTETIFQAPITPTACGATTFGTSISSAGALTCTQPAFTDLSGSLACSQLPAFGGDLASAGATCSVQVQAIEETSGPARLAINAIPDLGTGNPAILNRPGGTGTVVGSSVASIVDGHTPQTMFWSWNLLTSAALSNRYMCEGGQDNGTATCNEYPVLQSFSHVTLALNVTTNSCTGAGTPTFQVDLMKNGSIIINLPVSCGTTGIVNTGSVAFAAAAGDTVGLVYDGTLFGTGVGGGTSAFVTARFDP